MAQAPQVGTDLGGVVDHALRWHRVTHHHRLAGAHDAGFFAANAFTVGAEQLHVVQVDAGDEGAVGVDDVDRVEPAADADFQDHDVQAGGGHQTENCQHGELEIGQRCLAPQRLDAGKVRQQVGSLHDLAADAAALFKMDQMRRGVDAGAVAGLQQDSFQHRAAGALSVGAGHGNDRAVKFQRHATGHAVNSVQPQGYGRRVQALAVREPVVEGVRIVHTVSYCRRWRLPACSVGLSTLCLSRFPMLLNK